jgi:UDP-N-acetylmuramoyl-L-alanyl-D-glutamate--2,6-diaminopimelate ligase
VTATVDDVLVGIGLGPVGDLRPVVDVYDDSRDVQPGSIFVAVPGQHVHGKDYIAQAFGRGAVAILAEEPTRTDSPVFTVESARRAGAEAAAIVHGHPSLSIPVFGITGTDGKSTTSYFLASILEAAGFNPGMLTTVETRIGEAQSTRPSRMTTPTGPVVQRTLARMRDAGNRAAVLECSSHGLVQDRLRSVHLHSAAITNIARDHIDFHGSAVAYAQAKWSITKLIDPAVCIQGASAPSRLVLNRADETSMRLLKRSPIAARTFDLAAGADVCGQETPSEFTQISTGDETVLVRLPLPGWFNVLNALAATAMALTIGTPLATAAEGLESSPTPTGRLQYIDAGQTFKVVVDYAHTEQGVRALLDHLSSTKSQSHGRLIAVFGAGGGRDRDKRPKLAQIASQYTDFFIVTTEDPYDEDPLDIIQDIEAGAPADGRGVSWESIPDRAEAITRAVELARDDDIVAICGKGHEGSIVVGQTAHPWSDLDAAKAALETRAAR